MNDQSTSPVQTPAPAPVAPKKVDKRIHIAIAGLGIAILLVIIGAALYLVFSYISKSDYKQAETQTNSVISADNTLDTASVIYSQVARSGSSTDAEVTAKRASYDSTSTAYESAVKSLSSQRALKNSTVKVAYDAFVTKNKDFIANNVTFEQTMPMLYAIAVNCSESKIGTTGSDLSVVVAAYDKALEPCTTAMKGLSSSKDVNAVAVGKKAVAYFADMRTNIVAIQAAYIAKDRTTFESQYNTFLNKADLFSAETDTSSVQKISNTFSPQNELNHLAAVIQPLE